VTIAAVGNTTLTITGTGANISGTANVSGNTNANNLIATNIVYANNNLIVGSTQSEGGQLVLGWVGANAMTGQANSTWNLDVDGSNNARLFSQNATGTVNSVSLTAYNGNADVLFGANIINSNGYMLRSVGTSISAAGTVQANATAITKQMNVVSTVATGAGVVLPTAVAGMVITITNTSANSLLVYPAVNGIINSLAANAAFTQSSGSTLEFIAPTTTQWYTVGATYA
jgi:hypothetical protein